MSPKDKFWLEQLEKVMSDEISHPHFSVLRLAEAMNLSHSQLFRRLKSIMGLSPNQYIREKRLLLAKKLLETGTILSVDAAAKAVGLKSTIHFSRIFKKRFGKPPSKFIR